MDNAMITLTDPGTPKTRKPKKNPADRVPIIAEARSRLDGWLEFIAESMKTRLTRGDLINFLVLTRSEKLTEEELSEIEKQFFDEVKFGEWAMGELKEALRRGERTTLSEVIAKHRIKTIAHHGFERPKREKKAPRKSEKLGEKIAPTQPENSLISPRKSDGEML